MLHKHGNAAPEELIVDVRVLRYFIAAVEAESISGAAERLHLTQPTLSRQFMELEAELGHKLFVRSNRRLRLTPKGELFFERARAIVDLCDRTKREMLEEDELSGEIRIAAGETPALRTFARAVKRLQEAAPKVRCVVVSGAEPTVKAELHSGLTDLGVFVGTADVANYSAIRLRSKDVWGVLTRKDGPFAGKTRLEAKDLVNQPILCSSQAFERNEFAGWLHYLAEDLRIVGTFNLLYNAYLFAEAGVGHVLALRGIVNPEPESGVVWLPLYPKLEAEVVVAWEKNRRLTKPVQMLLDFLREEEAALGPLE